MKKVLTTLLALALLLTAAASCSGGTPAATTAATEAASTEASAAETQETQIPDNTTADTDISVNETAVTEEKIIPEDSKYVISDGITERMKALSELVYGNTARLKKVFKKAQDGENITVAFLGGSITQGSSAGDDKCYAKLTYEWFQKTFPDSDVTYVNAGIGATGSYIGVFRADRDVISKAPDIVFIDFSVNDTTEHTQRNIEAYDSLLRKLWYSESSPAIVTIAMTMEDGTSFQQYHSDICRAYGIPMISYHDAIMDVIKNGHIVWKDISDDNIHPNVTGHAVLTDIVTAYLQKVLDDVNNGGDEESDLSAVYSSDRYVNSSLVIPEKDTPLTSDGWETKTDKFGNFGGYWQVLSKDGSFDGVSSLSFEVEARSIGLFYGKMVANGGIFDVVVDGKVEKTINSDFKGGWGSYVEAEDIVDFGERGTHTVEIVPHTGSKAVINISAIALS